MSEKFRVPTSLLAAAVALLPLTACIPIPVDNFERGARENVSPKTVEQIRRCVTTREDVLMMLGEPDLVSNDERRIGYTWTKTKMLWIFLPANIELGGGWSTSTEGGTGETTRTYVLKIVFDEDNLVTQANLVKTWGFN